MNAQATVAWPYKQRLLELREGIARTATGRVSDMAAKRGGLSPAVSMEGTCRLLNGLISPPKPIMLSKFIAQRQKKEGKY